MNSFLFPQMFYTLLPYIIIASVFPLYCTNQNSSYPIIVSSLSFLFRILPEIFFIIYPSVNPVAFPLFILHDATFTSFLLIPGVNPSLGNQYSKLYYISLGTDGYTRCNTTAAIYQRVTRRGVPVYNTSLIAMLDLYFVTVGFRPLGYFPSGHCYCVTE